MDTGKPNTGYSRLPEETDNMPTQQPSLPPSYEQFQVDPNHQQGPPMPQPPIHGYVQAPPPQSMYTSTSNTTVVMAPSSQSTVQTLHVPDDHMVLAIFTTICCFWPVGIFAILKARDVHKKAWQRDMAGSMQASHSARTLSLIALGIGLGSIIISIIIIVAITVSVGSAVDHIDNYGN